MCLPSPKLRYLTSIIDATNSTETTKSNVWEIGVPSENSLYWSVLIGYLLSCDDERFSYFIEYLKTSDPIVSKNGTKLLSSNVNFTDVKERLSCFNPFKNGHVFFRDSTVLETFKWKLNQYGNMLSEDDTLTDEFKLNAAAKMLKCEIRVYLATKNEYVSYPQQQEKRNLPKIFIFKYPNRTHTSWLYINVFRFSMTVEHAYPLRLDALSHYMTKCKLPTEVVADIQQLMEYTQAHGDNFSFTILQSQHYNILPRIYASPYIALKLSRAGFETNPAVTLPVNPSAFLHAATKTDTKYIRILYDYAANCRYLFEPTVRDPNDAILKSLKKLDDIFENDKSIIDICDYDTSTKEQVLSIQKQFSSFNKYQQNVAHLITKLKNELQSGPQNLLHVRKKFIQEILSYYTDSKYFYEDSSKMDIFDKYDNYLKFTEYYENIDAFSCLTFFDSVFLLKKLFQLPGEDIFAPTESRFFLLTVSSRYFPKSLSDDSQTNSRMNENLRLIPFLQREALKEEIIKFLNAVTPVHDSSVPPNEIKIENLWTYLSSFPEIRDDFLISRIRNYLTAAIGVSFDEDPLKSILVVERALQVLGESIKPQSTQGCVVSWLLATRLPSKLMYDISSIRNDLSHYSDRSALGRLAIESKVESFKNLQSELQGILKRFEVVEFTQYLRLETMLIETSKLEIKKHQFDQNTVRQFLLTCDMRLNYKGSNYMIDHKDCIELSLDAIDYLTEYINNLKQSNRISEFNKLDINAIFQSIKYVFKFMIDYYGINAARLNIYLNELEGYCKEYGSSNEIVLFDNQVRDFQAQYKSEMHHIFQNFNYSSGLEFPEIYKILGFLNKTDISAKNVAEIVQAAKTSYADASEAKKFLVTYLKKQNINMTNTEDEMLNKLMITKDALKKLKTYFTDKNANAALRKLKKKSISIDSLVDKIEKLFKNDFAQDEIVKPLLIKIVYQRHLKTKIYTSAKLPDEIYKILETFFTTKLNFLLSRIEFMRSVLIEEDGEIEKVWVRGRNDEIGHHMRFLMRQRFLREMPVRASLEMAFIDCLNILQTKEFSELYEKVNNLFTGINLRDVLAHGHSVLETIGGLLDEDDLPSAFINTIIELIEDYDAIVTMRDIIPYVQTLEMDIFRNWIKDNIDTAFVQSIKDCKRWEKYLFLLPLI